MKKTLLLIIIIGVLVVLFVSIFKGYFKQGLIWEEQISAKELTEEEFTRLCQQAYKERLPGADVSIKG